MRDPSSNLSEEEIDELRTPALPDAPGAIKARRAMRRGTRATQHWARLLHVYTSMVCFVVVLFFAVTGVTLNHPTWSIGGESRTTATGTLPTGWKTGGQIDWLRVAEYLRSEHSLRGSVTGHNESLVQASIEWAAPAYVADAFIDVNKGTYSLTVESAGLLAMMNDLHKGRDAGSSWKWLIDVAGVFLALVSLTGIVLQLVLRKRRRAAIVTAAAGALVVVLVAIIAVS